MAYYDDEEYDEDEEEFDDFEDEFDEEDEYDDSDIREDDDKSDEYNNENNPNKGKGNNTRTSNTPKTPNATQGGGVSTGASGATGSAGSAGAAGAGAAGGSAAAGGGAAAGGVAILVIIVILIVLGGILTYNALNEFSRTALFARGFRLASQEFLSPDKITDLKFKNIEDLRKLLFSEQAEGGPQPLNSKGVDSSGKVVPKTENNLSQSKNQGELENEKKGVINIDRKVSYGKDEHYLVDLYFLSERNNFNSILWLDENGNKLEMQDSTSEEWWGIFSDNKWNVPKNFVNAYGDSTSARDAVYKMVEPALLSWKVPLAMHLGLKNSFFGESVLKAAKSEIVIQEYNVRTIIKRDKPGVLNTQYDVKTTKQYRLTYADTFTYNYKAKYRREVIKKKDGTPLYNQDLSNIGVLAYIGVSDYFLNNAPPPDYTTVIEGITTSYWYENLVQDGDPVITDKLKINEQGIIIENEDKIHKLIETTRFDFYDNGRISLGDARKRVLKPSDLKYGYDYLFDKEKLAYEIKKPENLNIDAYLEGKYGFDGNNLYSCDKLAWPVITATRK